MIGHLLQTVSAGSVSPSPEEALERARKEYGTVSTFAEVKGPNRISILLQGNSDVPSKCELNAPDTAPSPLVRSWNQLGFLGSLQKISVQLNDIGYTEENIL